MFFDNDNEGIFNADLYHVLRRELYAMSTSLEVTTPYSVRSVPTHTEDGIPIRKLYVSNLPPKTTRTELFGVFAQYGFIKSCWLRMGEKGPNKSPVPTYAFVTYSNPGDAHKALQAPPHEKALRGRNLRISPADSWHQPAEDSSGRVRWKQRVSNTDDTQEENGAASTETMSDNGEGSSSKDAQSSSQGDAKEEPTYSMLDILNTDCLSHILSYIPIRDLIRSERVSRGWQSMVHEYLHSIRMFKTSWWQYVGVTLTTAVLRRVLSRLGGTLLRLHIDHHWSALNDRTAHTVGKFCPHLEELKVVGMHTKNWNPIVYGCKQLKSLSFVSCNKLTDSSLVHLVKNDSTLESLTIANNTHVTGVFLIGSKPPKLNSLAFYNCYSLQGKELSTAIDTIPTLTTLKLDVCPIRMWKMVPLILSKLPKLEELSLSEYASDEICMTPQSNDAFCKAIASLVDLKILNLSRNVCVTDPVLKQIAQSCHQLETINVSSCNSRRSYQHQGVSDDGIAALCRGCSNIRHLDISYLAELSDAGAAHVAKLPHLTTLIARGNPTITAAPLVTCVSTCHYLEEIDVCGCDGVSEEVVSAAVHALNSHPRLLTLHLAATLADNVDPSEYPTHKQLRVDVSEDRSNPHLRPDFVDHVFDDSSDDSMDDLYEFDHNDFDDFLGPDEDMFLDEDLDNYEDLYAYGIHGPDIILL